MDAVPFSPVGAKTNGGPLDVDALLRTADDLPPGAPPIRILVVDGDLALRETSAKLLEADGYRVTVASRGDQALRLLERRAFEIIILDLQVSGVSGLELLRAIHATRPQSVVIAVTSRPSVNSSLAAFQSGAWDYVPKPFSATHLQLLVGRAAYGLTAVRERGDARLGPEAADATDDEFAAVWASPSIQKVVQLAKRVAPTGASVFITGESGTGKERMAEFIHRHSRRHARPLVAINCAAIPETLIETEMFGHRKGAFTGAIEDKQGLLEAANGGTFLLDELLQMPLSTQAKLLRVIQDGVVRRVGSDSVNAVVNVRFIAATNQSPEEAIRAGRLREDLFYRLRVFPIHLPPLRERREDIPLLADHFLRLFWTRHRPGSPLPRFSDQAKQALADHPWRGNVRELQNVIEHGVVLFEPGMLIRTPDIPFAPSVPRADAALDGEPFSLSETPVEQRFHDSREHFLSRFERRYLDWLLDRSDGNLSKAARIAGIQRSTLYHLLEKHGLRRQMVLRPADALPTSASESPAR